MSDRLPHVLAAIGVFLTTSINAQVWIADPAYRQALNWTIPGLVDASGNMDIEHPGLTQLDSVYLVVLNHTNPLVLEGLEHFQAVDRLFIRLGDVANPNETVVADVPQLPPAMAELELHITTQAGGTLSISGWPNSLDRFELGHWSGQQSDDTPLTLNLLGLTDSIPDVMLLSEISLQLDEPVHIGRLRWGNHSAGNDQQLPPLSADSIEVWGHHVGDLDMGAANTPKIKVGYTTCSGVFTWPSDVRNVQFAGWGGASFSWPNTMDTLFVGNANVCLPPFPDGLSQLSFQIDPQCIPNWPAELESFHSPMLGSVNEEAATYCSILDSECPGTYPALAGQVIMDLNNNGSVDEGEPPLPSSMVSVEPGGQSTGCVPDGSWEIGVPPGTHTITAANDYPYALSISPSSHVGVLPALGDVDLDNDFAVAVLPDIQDLHVHVSALPARPGFNNQVHLRCENYGTTVVDAQVSYSFDTDQGWVSSSLAPTSLTGNTATWNFPAMPIGMVHNLVIELNTAASVALGTELVHTLTAEPRSTDETPGDNSHAYTGVVVGSYDPNDKLLAPSAMSPDQVAAGATPIEYTIRFQNTGTFLAERVVIVDTLSEDLQWSSMRFIASSHAHQWYITDGVLHVIHNDIMLPDSTSDEPGSHGFFTFSMLPATDLQDGATVSNIAHIVFDFNEPIITPPAIFQVDVEAGLAEHTGGSSLRLVPNPAHDRLQVRGEGTALLRYRIIDVLGAQVQAGTLAPNGWVALDQLAEGPYVMEVEQGGVLSSQRFVKQ